MLTCVSPNLSQVRSTYFVTFYTASSTCGFTGKAFAEAIGVPTSDVQKGGDPKFAGGYWRTLAKMMLKAWGMSFPTNSGTASMTGAL